MFNEDSIKQAIKFMPESQAKCFMEGLFTSEQNYYSSIADKINSVVESAPAIYETDGQGNDTKPVLHYFWGNVDIFITEIDRESQQHYGYTSLGMGYLEGGYIDLQYLFTQLPLLNLDFNFTPKTIAEYKQIYEG